MALAYRLLFVIDEQLAQLIVQMHAALLVSSWRMVMEQIKQGSHALLCDADRIQTDHENQDAISMEALGVIEHPDIWDIATEAMATSGGDGVKVVLACGGTRDQATGASFPAWLRLLSVDEYRVSLPGRLDEGYDRATGYCWWPTRPTWELDAGCLALVDVDGADDQGPLP